MSATFPYFKLFSKAIPLYWITSKIHRFIFIQIKVNISSPFQKYLDTVVKYCRLGIAHFFLKYVAIFKRNIFELYLKYRESLLFPPLRFHQKYYHKVREKRQNKLGNFFLVKTRKIYLINQSTFRVFQAIYTRSYKNK